MESETENLSAVLSAEQLRRLARARGDTLAFLREMLLRVNRPDLASDYRAMHEIMRIANALENS